MEERQHDRKELSGGEGFLTRFLARFNMTFLFLVFILVWTSLIVILGFLSFRGAATESGDMVLRTARETYNRDLVYRRWATMHGGVYVPVSEVTQPNPYLSHLPERDISTPSGKKLTLINPAYMTRQVHELGKAQYGLRGHITSLNPIRPQNAPDGWEVNALTEFAKGVKEEYSLDTIEGEVYFRLMRPMVTEKGCLKCHASQGYKVGDVRGGISISVPWKPVRESLERQQGIMIKAYTGIWIIGLLGIIFSWKSLAIQFNQRRRAEELIRQSEEQFKSLITRMKQGVAVHEVICNEKGEVVDYRFLDMNESFEQMTGMKKEETAGKRVLEVMPRTEKSWIERYGKVALTGEPVFFENYAEELKKHFSVVAYRPRPGQFAVIVIDITHFKEIEREIKMRNEQLETLAAQKDKFFSIIAHDLKNPFNSLIGFSGILVQQIESVDYASAGKMAGIIHQTSTRTYELLVNLLEWAASQTGQIRFAPEPIDLKALGEEIFQLLETTFRNKSIDLSIEIPELSPVMADRSMISTIVRNLVTNALKFTKPGGRVVVSAATKADETVITVTDSGVGIDAEKLAGLFRIESSSTTEGTLNEKGTGLGLLLCQEFVEKHGGRIWAESIPGEGSSFHFTIPKDPVPGAYSVPA